MPAILATLCTVLAALAFVDPRWHRWLDYQRESVAAGQAWRLVTGHAMHVSIAHATLDIGALLIVAWIFGRTLGAARQFIAIATAVVCIDASLWFLHPEVARYVGLSGVLHAWFAMGSVLWLIERGPTRQRVARKAWGAALAATLCAKLFIESRDGAFWLRSVDFAVVTAAHRAGAAAGLCCAVACGLLSRRATPAAADAASRDPRRTG